MTTITSRQNPKIKLVRALHQRKQRDGQGLFVVEGIHHVGAAAEAGAAFEYLLYAPEQLSSAFADQLIERLAQRKVPCYPVRAEVFSSIADKENPQGLLAVLRQPQRRLADTNPGNFAWGVALVAPQDPGNLGSILRTIDAVGTDGLILLDGGVDAYHPSAVRASMGALFRHPVLSASFGEFAAWAGKHGYHVYGSSAQRGTDIRSIDSYDGPAILLLGSERTGLDEEQASICQQIIRLPMAGKVTSLNLSVAAGILLYDMQDKLKK